MKQREKGKERHERAHQSMSVSVSYSVSLSGLSLLHMSICVPHMCSMKNQKYIQS